MSWKIALCATVVCACLWGCDDPPQVKRDENADAGTQAPIADKHIANALASAATTAQPGPTDDGPPPNGVFPEGEADKRQPAGVPPKATMVGNGGDPKARWLPLMKFTEPQLFELSLIRADAKSGVAVKFVLAATLPSAAPEGDEEKKAEPKGAPQAGEGKDEPNPAPAAAEPVTEPTAIHFVVRAVAAHEQLAQAPKKELELLMKSLETLVGTRVAAVLQPNGALTNETFELAKDADPQAVEAVRALAEVLGLFFSPWPDQDVGVGAYWIAGDRASMGGLDLVRYRVSKVEEMKGDEMAMSVDLRMYAATPTTLPKGTAAGAIALQFQGQGKAMVTRRKGQILPIQGNIQSPMALQYAASPEAQVGQVYQVQNVAAWSAPTAPDKNDKGDPKAP